MYSTASDLLVFRYTANPLVKDTPVIRIRAIVIEEQVNQQAKIALSAFVLTRI